MKYESLAYIGSRFGTKAARPIERCWNFGTVA
jgi:hypothetical protein